MSITEYLADRPIHYPAQLGDVKRAFKASGGELPDTAYALRLAIEAAGYRVRGGLGVVMVLPIDASMRQNG